MLQKIKDWLYEQGGPAVHLRLHHLEPEHYKDEKIRNAVSKLLAMEEVHETMNYLDGFHTQARDKKTLEHLMHYYKDICIDNFFPLILDLGFRAGTDVLDEKMKPVAEMFRYLYAYANEYEDCYFYSLILHRFFFMAGYKLPEVVESMRSRLNAIHSAAKEKVFAIYREEGKLPKKPKIWEDIGVLKEEYSPYHITAKEPLPNIYDIWALAYYSQICKDKEQLLQINDIVEYILEPDFQKIPNYYGLLWTKAKRRYHMCGWCPTMPLYELENQAMQSVPFRRLDYLDMMSRFEVAGKSEWFVSFLKHFEQFKTERGTYMLPKEYLHKKYIDQAFLSEENMNLKLNERRRLKYEIAGTLRMYEIYSCLLPGLKFL